MSAADASLASLAADERAEHRRSALTILYAARAKTRTALGIGDSLLRNRALRKIASDLARPWPAGEIRDAAEALQRAIDDVAVRGHRLINLAEFLGDLTACLGR